MPEDVAFCTAMRARPDDYALPSLEECMNFAIESAGNPARAVGLDDRGASAPERRADLVRVHLLEGAPIVRSVWREGGRIV